MEIEKGIIYVASGEKYVHEATVSAKSVKQVMPEVPIVLHTDVEVHEDCFDQVLRLENCRHNCYDKVPPLQDSPFEKTIFLDTDTYVTDRLDDLFILLDRYDLLVCHTPYRDPNPIEGVPSVFTEFNTGMLAFRKNDRLRFCFENWLKYYEELGHRADQPALRKSLWEDGEIRFYVLPPEYNFRTIFPGFIGGGFRVKIFHGRHANWDPIVRKVNRNDKPRLMALTPLARWNGELIHLRTWWDLFKSFLKNRMKK